MIFQMGELFSGPGGIALGARMASFQHGSEIYAVSHKVATDYDESTCKTYGLNIVGDPDSSAVKCEDIRKMDLNKLPAIDALAFGFPCNDFSIVGESKGINGTFGPLYKYGVKVIELKRPKWFMAENVGGLQGANGGETFKKILDDLKNAGNGYRLTTHLYKFEDYGVPQNRHRIIIIGIDKTQGLTFRVPKPTGVRISAGEAITRIPIPGDAPNNELTRQSASVVERLKHIPQGENAWYHGIPKEHQLNVKGARLSQIYKRLKYDEPSYTVTGSGGGGTHVYHWSENRALTNRERARLQTFPDDFVFIGSKEQVRKQIGMAVPPLGAMHIIKAVLKTFARIDYPSIEPHWDMEDELIT